MADERADIEHHVRTQLTTISIAGQLIQRDSLSSDRHRRLAGEIVSACNRLQECLEELLAQRFGDDPV